MLTWLLWGAGSFLAGWFVGQLDRMAYNDRQRRRTQRSTNICEFKTRATITQLPSSTPPPGSRRVYYDMPSTIAECGGPCSAGGPEFCDCGALWCDVPETLLPKWKYAPFYGWRDSPTDTCPPKPQ